MRSEKIALIHFPFGKGAPQQPTANDRPHPGFAPHLKSYITAPFSLVLFVWIVSIRKHRDNFHAPRGFCSERRHFSFWQGKSLPSFATSSGPVHLPKGGLARRRTWVPPSGASRSAIEPAEASAATAEISTLREAWRSHRQGGKAPFPGGNELDFVKSISLGSTFPDLCPYGLRSPDAPSALSTTALYLTWTKFLSKSISSFSMASCSFLVK